MALAVTALGLAGCSSGSSPEATKGSNGADQAGLAGKPIKIGVPYTEGVVGLSYPQPAIAAKAAVKYINANGGIAGRPVEADLCNDQGDPSKDTQCAVQFVDDGVVAVVGQALAWGANGLQLTAKAKIPSFNRASFKTELTDPTSFPQGSSAAEFASIGAYLAKEHNAKRIDIVGVAAAKLATDAFVAAPLKKLGFAEPKFVEFPTGAPDYAPNAQTVVSDKPDVVVVAVGPGDVPHVLTALRQAGYTGPLGTTTTGLDVKNILQPAGSAANGMYFATPLKNTYDGTDPQVSTFLKAMATVNGPTDVYTQVLFGAWMNVAQFVKAAGADNISGPSLLTYMGGLSSYQKFMGPTVLKADAPTAWPQLWATESVIVQWNGAKLVDVPSGMVKASL